MNKECRICGTLKWKEEYAGMCCSGGKVALPLIDEPVEPLKELFSYETDEYSARLSQSKAKYTTQLALCASCYQYAPKVLQVYFMGDKEAQVNRRSEYVQGAYAQKLLEIGEGHLDTDQKGMVLFTHQFCHVVELEDKLIDQVLPNMQQHILDEKWLCERTIVAPKNVHPSDWAPKSHHVGIVMPEQ
ncbi:helitron_like_N domain-containing protein [Trichonephila clavipes]|uniref:Helitron_like_N domain-containing protein n=1 Tax=Trichonephila clavipes TaxID=2585209 RepID=A0A8X6SBG0_TRICX|nr:helitron_like_N domain-containing protein [Trichonephila clavipes]